MLCYAALFYAAKVAPKCGPKWLQNGPKMAPKWGLGASRWDPKSDLGSFGLLEGSWNALGGVPGQKKVVWRALVGQKKSFKTVFSQKKMVKSGPRASKSDSETGFKPNSLIFTVFSEHRHFCIRTASGAQKTRLGGPWSAQKKLSRQFSAKKK